MGDNPEARLIQGRAEFIEVCDRLSAGGGFAFDTEFVGEDQYEAQVCLIQVATAEFCALVDPLAGLDTRPFWELIADPRMEVIVHSGAEDLTLCRQQLGRPPANVLDLQIAGGLLGLGYPLSLSRLARLTIGRTIHKSQTLTDWRTRPLSREQIDYAVEDVIYLPPIFEWMRKRLTSMGRLEWLRAECDELCAACGTELTREQRTRRIKGIGSMNRRELAITEALVEEREALARHFNRPPRVILKDYLLVEMARRGWTDPKRLATLRGVSLNAWALQRIARVIGEARNLPAESCPAVTADEDTPEEETLLSLLSAILRDYCQRSQLAFSLLANRQDLRSAVRRLTRPGEASNGDALHSGWRGTAVGGLIESILSGRQSVRVVKQGRKVSLSVEPPGGSD